MLKDQIAIVTGASRGIGKEIAVKLAEQGMKLAIIGSSAQISETADELKSKGFPHILPIQADVSYMASAPKYMLIDEIVLHPLVQQYPIA